jgi:hypothetical protein
LYGQILSPFLKRICRSSSGVFFFIAKSPRPALGIVDVFIRRLCSNKEEYDWLSDDTIDECKKLLDKHILSDTDNPNDISQEVTIIENNMITEQELIDNALRCYMGKDIPEAKYCFAARVDMITKKTIWEIKCTSQISIEYLLQVVIYAWLWYTLYPKSDKVFKILNIKTGEVLKLVSSVQKLTRIVVLLLKGKYDTPKILNDEDFRSCFDIWVI